VTVYKRQGIYHYDFMFAGKRYRGTTYMSRESDAVKYEAQKIIEARLGVLGERRVPVLAEYLDKFEEVLPDLVGKIKTKRYYLNGVKLLRESRLTAQRLNAIDDKLVRKLAFDERPSTYNCAVRTLRRVLGVARDERVINAAPKLSLMKEVEREGVFSQEVASAIIEAAPQPLRDVFIIISDAGLRPEEVFRMRIEMINWQLGNYFNEKGKTKNSRRYVPVSTRMATAIRARIGNKKSGWVFPSKHSASGHLTTVEKQWLQLRKDLSLPRDLVLYSARHTFGTLVYSATKNLKITMEVMGHGDTRTTMRYQHPEVVESVRDVINQRNDKENK
jgi:integrase